MKGYRIREEKYKRFGLNDFRLKTAEDIANILDVYTDEISGYDALNEEHKKCFDSFIVNFFNSFGLEARASIMPTKVYLVDSIEDDSDVAKLGTYLRFNYTRFFGTGDKSDCWLHVINQNEYY